MTKRYSVTRSVDFGHMRKETEYRYDSYSDAFVKFAAEAAYLSDTFKIADWDVSLYDNEDQALKLTVSSTDFDA